MNTLPLELPESEPQYREFHRGELHDPAAIRRFIEAGHAIVTLVSRKTGARFTYQFSRPDVDEQQPDKPRPIWARLLNGPDNTTDFVFIGTFWPVAEHYEYRRSAKVPLAESAPSIAAVRWFMLMLGSNPAALNQLEVYHEGRCGRCGRRLTVPESISSGFGPECIQYV